MTDTSIQLSEDEFDELFACIPNHLNPEAGWVYGEGPGSLFETYGQELEFVLRQDPRTVWTLVDGDDGDLYVLSGYHLVNRVGHLITATPVPEGTDFEVHIPTGDRGEGTSGEVPEPATDALSRIAGEHLHIQTLETRNSDSLDFHDVAVWCVKGALEAASRAGSEQEVRRSAALRSACRMVVERWEHGDLAEAARACAAALGHASHPSPHQDACPPARFDAYEIHGMRRIPGNGREGEPVGHGVEDCEAVPDDRAEFWSLFGHIPGRGIDCIGDFATREHAEEILARITGRDYTNAARTARREKP